MYQIIRLLNLSALSFSRGKLNINAAMSYFSMVMVWEAFLEVLPWEKDKDKHLLELMDKDTQASYKKVQELIKKFERTTITGTGYLRHNKKLSISLDTIQVRHIIIL